MSYERLEAHHRKLSQLRHTEAIVAWDEAALMPPGGGEARADALATLRGLIHECATDARLGDWFAAAEAQSGALGTWQSANLREMRREWTRSN
ncbi:MAG TPA: hypothetical protein VFQ35_05695, partial [Polyangiaceae bacterium]|nr:hypothetical protein [Polyangiaceae bacterium]